MTVSVNDRRREYPGNSVATVFNGPMAYQTSHILAYLVDDVTGVPVQVPGANFTVELLGREAGTRVVMSVPPPTGQTLLLLREVPEAQLVDITNQGSFNASIIERGLDLLEMQIQQVADSVAHKIGVPDTAIGLTSLDMPTPVPDVLWGWNSTASAPRYYTLNELATNIAYGNKIVNIANGNGVQTAFVLSQDPVSVNNLDVSIDGVVQTNGVDFTLAGTTLNFASPPPNLSVILVRFDVALAIGSGSASTTSFQAAGAGAVVRTAQNKMRERVTPQDFGAVGNNITDDTAAFQAALVATAGGFVLDIPPGAYKITSALVMGLTSRIRGAGNKSTFLFFTLAPGSNARLISHNFAGGTIYGGGICDLSVIDQTVNTDTTGIYVEDTLYFAIERVIPSGMHKGIHLNACFQARVSDCFLGDMGGIKATAIGFHAQNFTGVGIFDCIITSDTTPANQIGIGYLFDTGASPTMHSANTYGCRVGCRIVGSAGTTTFWPELVNCQFDTAADTGLQIVAEAGGAISGMTIENLWCATFSAYGMFVDEGAGIISGITMNGGRVLGNLQGGIVLQKCRDVGIRGVLVSGNGTIPSPQAGIAITGVCTRVQICNNQIGQAMLYGNVQSFGIVVAAVAADFLTITGNDVSANISSMAVQATGTNLKIIDNLGFDNTYGGALASAGTLAIGTSQNNRALGLTGTTTINTITPAYEGLTLFFVKADAGALPFGTAGNIAAAYSISPGDAIQLRFISGKFYKV